MKIRINGLLASLLLLASGVVSAAMPEPMPPMPGPMADSNVVYSDLQFVFGFDQSISPFYIHNAGVYQATLTDFEWPNSFDYLGLMITQGTTTKMGVIEGSGSFTFEAGPGMYNALLVASVNGDMMPMMGFGPVSNMGVYGVQVAMVPETEVWIMMLMGLGFVVYQVRRASSVVPAAPMLAA